MLKVATLLQQDVHHLAGEGKGERKGGEGGRDKGRQERQGRGKGRDSGTWSTNLSDVQYMR